MGRGWGVAVAVGGGGTVGKGAASGAADGAGAAAARVGGMGRGVAVNTNALEASGEASVTDLQATNPQRSSSQIVRCQLPHTLGGNPFICFGPGVAVFWLLGRRGRRAWIKIRLRR